MLYFLILLYLLIDLKGIKYHFTFCHIEIINVNTINLIIIIYKRLLCYIIVLIIF